MRVFLHIFGQACCRLIMFSAQSDHDEFMSLLTAWACTVLHFWVVPHHTNVVCFQLSALHHLNKHYTVTVDPLTRLALTLLPAQKVSEGQQPTPLQITYCPLLLTVLVYYLSFKLVYSIVV